MAISGIKSDGGWVQTMVGAISAIVITGGSMYTVIISPMQVRIDRLEAGREKDRDQLALLYTSIQTNDEYKKTIGVELTWVRSDLAKVQAEADASAELHKERAGQGAQIAGLQIARDRLDRRNEEQDRELRTELENLRQRVAPAGAPVK